MGLTLFEPFGGICSGLEAALRAGLPIRRYIYCDTSTAACLIAKHRVAQLMAYYPSLLKAEAVADAFTTLPQDVYSIRPAELAALAREQGGPWLTVAGWECQDLSQAGGGAGLDGKHSSSFFPLLRLLRTLQLAFPPDAPPAHIIENTPFQHHSQSHIRAQFSQVCLALGQPVTLDAAQFASRAHRLRNFWTNLMPAEALQATAAVVRRPAGLRVQDILDPGRLAPPAQSTDRAPWAVCNHSNEPLSALPTLVARRLSHAFRPGCKGSILIADTAQWDEPNADERERAMGYQTGATAAPGVTERQRRESLGRCIDANTLQTIFAIGVAWGTQSARAAGVHAPCVGPRQGSAGPAQPVLGPSQESCAQHGPGGKRAGSQGSSPPCAPASGSCSEGQGGTRLITAPSPAAGPSRGRPSLPGNATPSSPHTCAWSRAQGAAYSPASCAATCGDSHPALSMSTPDRFTSPGNEADTDSSGQLPGLCLSELLRADVAATAADASAAPYGQSRDIWEDSTTLHLLQHSAYPPGVTAAVRTRASKRLRYYTWRGGKLYFLMPDGATRLVPRPEERRALIRDAHARTGHFGTRRTYALLLTAHWWNGMARDVRDELQRCDLCARARASFNSPTPHLQPLPICGLFYRWGCDLFGPLPATTDGYRYVLVAIEHLSKHIELVPLQDKTSGSTARAFAAAVLGRFGAPAEVLTDRGSEWGGKFEELLLQCMIDHRTTSAHHPQADGLAERAVGTCKRALRKMVEQKGTVATWADELPWLTLGYNCSPQKSTGFSPYHLLYAHTPTVPPAIRERVQVPLDFDTPAMQELTAMRLLQRAKAVKRDVITAGNNLRIAQHRDTLRYAAVRRGDYQARLRGFAPGDFVYVQQQSGPSLQLPARPVILRVKEARELGVLVLQGNDGTTVKLHCSRCAPCHLPNIDTRIDATRARVPASEPCQICGSPDDENLMLICDACSNGYHLHCLVPPLTRPPRGRWLCPTCTAAGVTAQDIEVTAEAVADRAAEEGGQAPVVGTNPMLAKDAAARALHGRLARRMFPVPGLPEPQWFYGRLHFRGPTFRPYYFQLTYQDGDYEINTLPMMEKKGLELLAPDAVLPTSVRIPAAADANPRRKGTLQPAGEPGLPAV